MLGPKIVSDEGSGRHSHTAGRNRQTCPGGSLQSLHSVACCHSPHKACRGLSGYGGLACTWMPTCRPKAIHCLFPSPSANKKAACYATHMVVQKAMVCSSPCTIPNMHCTHASVPSHNATQRCSESHCGSTQGCKSPQGRIAPFMASAVRQAACRKLQIA